MHVCVTRPQWVNAGDMDPKNRNGKQLLVGVFLIESSRPCGSSSFRVNTKHSEMFALAPTVKRHNLCCSLTICLMRRWHLTHWHRVTQICGGNLTITGSGNGLSPGRRQASIWTTAKLFIIGPLGTNLRKILIEIHTFSFKKMHLKVSGKWRPFCVGLGEFKQTLFVVILPLIFITKVKVSSNKWLQIFHNWYFFAR